MKVIKINEPISSLIEILAVVDSYVEDSNQFTGGLVGITDEEVKIVDNVLEIAFVIPLALDEWSTDELAKVLDNTTSLSLDLSEEFAEELGFEEYSLEDFIPWDIHLLPFADIRIGQIHETHTADGIGNLNILNKDYWSTVTGQTQTQPKAQQQANQVQNQKPNVQPNQSQAQNQANLQQAQQANANSAKLIVRDAIKAAFDNTEPLTPEEKSRLDYIYLNLFKHKLKEGNPLEDFKYDILRVKRTKYTNVYILKTPNVIYDTVIKKREQITGIFSPQEVFKIEQNYKAIAGVYAIHVNKDTSIMQETQSLMDFYLKRNRFADEDLTFGDPTKMVIGFSPSGLIDVDTTAAGACHILVAGSTGSGKSVTMQMIIMQSIADGALLFYFDPKNSDSAMYRKYGIAIATEPEQMLEYMEKVYTLYKIQKDKVSEYKDLKGYNKRNPDNPLRRIMVCFDEYESFINMVKGAKDPLHRVDDILTELCAKGRSVGVFVVMGSQTPAAKFFNQSLRMNLQVKLLGVGCAPYFKAYDMDKLQPVPLPPAENPYLYAGTFTCKNTESRIKSLYLEVGDISPELDNKTELDYLMDIFQDQGLLVATQEILDRITIEGTDEDGEPSEGMSSEEGFDLLESLSKPIIEDVTEYDEIDDEDEEDYENEEDAETATHTKSSKSNKKKHSEEKSNAEQYRRDNNLTSREKQVMAEYFDIIDSNTYRHAIKTNDIPLILTGKSAKVPDTTLPKYNLFSSFSLKNKLKAKSIGFIGFFSKGVADKLRYSIGLENSVAKKASYIFMYTFSKSRTLDNIKSMAMCLNTQTIYINDIPRLLENDININDSEPFSDKYSVIGPENFFYPHLESINSLEELFFDSPLLAYKAMEQINTEVFGDTGNSGVDILFDCQPSLKKITIYDKTYYRSSARARKARRENRNEVKTHEEQITQNPASSLLASQSYQDEIDAFYREQEAKEIEEAFARDELERLRRESQELNQENEIALEQEVNAILEEAFINGELAGSNLIEDGLLDKYLEEENEPLETASEIVQDINEPLNMDTPLDIDTPLNMDITLDMNTQPLLEQEENSIAELVIGRQVERDHVFSEETENLIRATPALDKQLAKLAWLDTHIKEQYDYGVQKEETKIHNTKAKLKKISINSQTIYKAGYKESAYGSVLEYESAISKSLIKATILSNAPELLDIRENTKLATSFIIQDTISYAVITSPKRITMAGFDIREMIDTTINNSKAELMRESITTLAYVITNKIKGFHTDNPITQYLLMLYLMETGKEIATITDNSNLIHLPQIVDSYRNKRKYLISQEKHFALETINNKPITEDIKSSVIDICTTLLKPSLYTPLHEVITTIAEELSIVDMFEVMTEQSKNILADNDTLQKEHKAIDITTDQFQLQYLIDSL